MSRNSAGTYQLPATNPVVSGTTIAVAWGNGTMSDIATELTSSLDRSGRGAMLAPLKLTDGTLTAPGLCFNSEQTTGLYRSATGTMVLVVLGVAVATLTSTAFTINQPVAITSGTVSGAINFTTAPTLPTQAVGDNSTTAANTAFVQAALTAAGYATVIAAAAAQYNGVSALSAMSFIGYQ